MRYALVAIVIAACAEEPFVAPEPVVQSHVDTYELYGQFPTTVDVLFVVGDLGGRDISSLAKTVDELLPTWFGGFPNVRVATTSSSDVLEISTDILGQRSQNFEGSLADALSSRLTAGPSNVLERTVAAAAFSQPKHYLAIVMLTATDDTSPPADYVHLLESLKEDPANVIVAGISAPSSPTLDAFYSGFPYRSTVTSIDATDFAPAFTLFPYLQRMIIPLPCFVLPSECTEFAVSAWTNDNVEITQLPQCTGGPPESGTCWDIVTDPNCNIIPNERPRGVTRLRGFWGGWRPVTRWQCATK